MTDFDPIRTVYDHLSGRQPVALMVSYLQEEQTRWYMFNERVILFQNGREPYEKQYHNSWTALSEDLRGLSGFQVMGMVEWGQKSKPKKIPSASYNPLSKKNKKNNNNNKKTWTKVNPPKFPYWISEPY